MYGERSAVGLVLKTLIICTIAVRDALPTTVSPAEPYQSLLPTQGLYNSSDSVVVLNSTSFKRIVHGSEHGCLVEFYNSWCGFCQRFAPTWKALAHNVLSK